MGGGGLDAAGVLLRGLPFASSPRRGALWSCSGCAASVVARTHASLVTRGCVAIVAESSTHRPSIWCGGRGCSACRSAGVTVLLAPCWQLPRSPLRLPGPFPSALPPTRSPRPQIHVQQLPSSSDGAGVGWFLDRIEVAGPEGQHWLFPCSAWLGKANHPAGLDGAQLRSPPARPARPRAVLGSSARGRVGAAAACAVRLFKGRRGAPRRRASRPTCRRSGGRLAGLAKEAHGPALELGLPCTLNPKNDGHFAPIDVVASPAPAPLRLQATTSATWLRQWCAPPPTTP